MDLAKEQTRDMIQNLIFYEVYLPVLFLFDIIGAAFRELRRAGNPHLT